MLNCLYLGVLQTMQKSLGNLGKLNIFFFMLPIIWALWKCSHKMLEKVWQFENCYGAWSFRADYIGWIKKRSFLLYKKSGDLQNSDDRKKNSGSLRILRLPSKIMKVENFQWCPNKYLRHSGKILMFEIFWHFDDFCAA